MSTVKLIKRHELIVLLEHWGIAISGIALLMSGIFQLPSAARYKITAIPGFWWSGEFFFTLKLHYIASVVFVGLVLFHLVYHLLLQERAMIPQSGDVSESVKVLKTFITNQPEPPFGKYLPEQRLAYVAIAIPVLLLVVSGLIKTWKNIYAPDLDRTLLLWATWMHNVGFILFFMAFLGHVAALLIKPNRPMLRGMLTGRVTREYAEHRHPRWVSEIEKNET
ncbi:cytochrome b/b6 domain-containing protein [Trichlorobacter lovleyi]|uniref:formate dehydrogenase subunit gamma n=1 Tax=Trichlorobacter lovleyi TaxID=313985 RepID=UPI00223F8C41|nr:cytochrome b/b6 domain-containing protein [Trichlorobacter lovleyi]QOX78820.1 cytochrome b/b6 domain-containing protein [Trichlorobacter lovleyi]